MDDHRTNDADYYGLFLRSRLALGVTQGTLRFYRVKLEKFLGEIDVNTADRQDIEEFLLQFENRGNRHAYFRVLRTFYNWREDVFELPNPMKRMRTPKLSKLIMPSLSQEQVQILIDNADSIRDKAIISLFTESGLRLSELARIKPKDIEWGNRIIRVIGKGRKEAYAPFGYSTERYLKRWLKELQPGNARSIWGMNEWGIISMLRRLKQATGLPCNPHVFRRTFACLLRKAGVDTMTIKDLGRWESITMVQHYTRSFDFHDSLKFYKPPLS